MAKKIIKWKVEAEDWFELILQEVTYFEDFMSEVLDQKGSHGKVVIQLPDKTYLILTYENGVITRVSDDLINRLDKAVVTSARAHGFPQQINYYISVRR